MMEDPKVIAAVVGLLLALTALVKVYTDILKIKADRKDTAALRSADSADMHDQLLKHEFAITSLKDNMALHSTVISDIQTTMSELNTTCVKLSVVVDNLSAVVKELKNERA